MRLIPLGQLELRYTALTTVDFGGDGQLYGTMTGTLTGDAVQGRLELTNLAARRPDHVNLPTLRGLLTTDDGAVVWVELDGVATLRATDQARVFVTTVRCRTGDARYAWLNTSFGLLEGVLDTVASGGVARGQVFRCEPTLGLAEDDSV